MKYQQNQNRFSQPLQFITRLLCDYITEINAYMTFQNMNEKQVQKKCTINYCLDFVSDKSSKMQDACNGCISVIKYI